ncbi:hypothetical protein G9A89_011069 [Geosiphon pyriformis]|nr:hypothetical protein G9A89_011069 [Geosiphon pyriformis]
MSVCSLLLDNCGSSDVLQSYKFGAIYGDLLCADVNYLFAYTNKSLSGLGTFDMKAGAAVFFENISMGLGVGVFSLMFSIMVELQAIALAFKCVLSFHTINLFLDSQAALDTCKSKLELAHPDFKNWC